MARFAGGAARGRREGDLCVFRGIRYATPPAGEGRWRAPRPAPPWRGVLDAGEPGPACVQPPRRAGSLYASSLPGTGEDCLSLDIWAPEGAGGLPVLVWIHGGSLVWGAGSEPHHDGAALARRGMVVVAINYRLGVFGYLAHPELSAESPDGVSGNYGLLDQIAALEWVRDNIAAVGGDPGKVTIAGESAGALSVLALMAAPRARGLFAGAIAQSAYLISSPHLKERRHGEEPAEEAGARLAKALGAADIAALRAMDAQALADAAARAGHLPSPTIDGHVLPRQLVESFERGEQARVPLLAGFNSGEVRSLPFLMPERPGSAAAYEAGIRSRLGDLADRFLALYPPDAMEESMLAAIRDALYAWTAIRLAAAHKADAFLYYFDHGYPAAEAAGLRGFHACEIPYVFGTADRAPPRWPKAPATAGEAALSQAIGDYWAAFAKRGVPHADWLPRWPAWAETGAFMRFDGEPRLSGPLFAQAFALHDEVVRRRRAAGDVPWNWNVGVASPPLPASEAV